MPKVLIEAEYDEDRVEYSKKHPDNPSLPRNVEDLKLSVIDIQGPWRGAQYPLKSYMVPKKQLLLNHFLCCPDCGGVLDVMSFDGCCDSTTLSGECADCKSSFDIHSTIIPNDI